MQLENKAAIVTGGARGIGLAIAKRYVTEGAKVVIADVDAAAGEAAASALDGARCSFVRTDVRDPRDADHAVPQACRLVGGIDILSNNSRIVAGADFLHLVGADFHRR